MTKFSQKKSVLTKHLRIHALEKPYQYKSFSQKIVLNTCLNTHTGGNTDEFNNCDRELLINQNLTFHLNSHIDIKQSQCNPQRNTLWEKQILERPQSIHSHIVKDEQMDSKDNGTSPLFDTACEVNEEQRDFKTCEVDNLSQSNVDVKGEVLDILFP